MIAPNFENVLQLLVRERVPFMRRQLRTLAVPVQMKDQSWRHPAADERSKNAIPGVVDPDHVAGCEAS
jgi:hypothetical protein